MFTCKVCGRKFKSMNALGGHVSHAHMQAPAETTVHENTNPGPGEAETTNPVEAEPEDESKADEIRGYIAQGYKFEQLVHDLHFPETSVRREWAKRIQPEPDAQSDQSGSLPAIYKHTEVISPEALLRRYTNGGYEDDLKLRGKMELWASVLVVMELANIQKTMAEAEAKRLEPLLKVLREGREELDAAAARARGQSFEMAQEAADGAVSRVLGYIDQKIPKGPPPKDTDDVLTRMLGKMTDMMMHTFESQAFPQQAANKTPEGWEYVDHSRRPQPQAQPQPQPQEQPQAHRGVPPGWASGAELEEQEEKEDNSDG
jgi:hypothetical protein